MFFVDAHMVPYRLQFQDLGYAEGIAVSDGIASASKKL